MHFLSVDNEMVIKCVLAPFWGLFVDLPLVQRLMIPAGVGIVCTQGSSKMVGTGEILLGAQVEVVVAGVVQHGIQADG